MNNNNNNTYFKHVGNKTVNMSSVDILDYVDILE